jgi:hypothetical protein
MPSLIHHADIPEAKRRLALTLGVKEEDIKIIING